MRVLLRYPTSLVGFPWDTVQSAAVLRQKARQAQECLSLTILSTPPPLLVLLLATSKS